VQVRRVTAVIPAVTSVKASEPYACRHSSDAASAAAMNVTMSTSTGIDLIALFSFFPPPYPIYVFIGLKYKDENVLSKFHQSSSIAMSSRAPLYQQRFEEVQDIYRTAVSFFIVP
jgi:hypothetical protein